MNILSLEIRHNVYFLTTKSFYQIFFEIMQNKIIVSSFKFAKKSAFYREVLKCLCLTLVLWVFSPMFEYMSLTCIFII